MPDACVHDTPDTPQAPPCTLVIFGAGGDLTKRLLMPALYNLAGGGLLDERFSVLGVDHNPLTDDGWRDDLTTTMDSFTKDPSAEFHAQRIDPRLRQPVLSQRSTRPEPRLRPTRELVSTPSGQRAAVRRGDPHRQDFQLSARRSTER